MRAKTQTHAEYVKQLETLWDMVSDMVEGGRLQEASIPDDYSALVQQMAQLQALHFECSTEAEASLITAPAAAKYIPRDAVLVTKDGEARVVASDRDTGLVTVRYSTGVLAGRERIETALHEGFADLVSEGRKAEAEKKALLGVPESWELASEYTQDIFDGVGRAVCEKRFGGAGTPYVPCDMTVVESRAGGYIPIHGGVKMAVVGSVAAAAAALDSYWSLLPDSARVAVRPSVKPALPKELGRKSTSLGM